MIYRNFIKYFAFLSFYLSLCKSLPELCQTHGVLPFQTAILLKFFLEGKCKV